MNKEIQIRNAVDSDIIKIITLHNKTYGESRSPDKWSWEYKGIYPESFVFAVIDDNEEIVGSQGMIPIFININSMKYLSGKSENSLLNPNYRGGTWFKDMYDFAMSECAKKGMFCVWGFTSAVKVWRKKLGFLVFEDVMFSSILVPNLKNALSKVFNSDRTFGRKLKVSFLETSAYIYSQLLRPFRRPSKVSQSKYKIEEKPRKIKDIEELYARFREEYPGLVHMELDEDYINWRIINNPNVKYNSLYLYKNDSLKAYCFTSLKNSEIAYITDITYEDRAAGAFLLYTLLTKFRREKIAEVSFYGNVRSPMIMDIFNLLKSFGFVKRADASAFVLKNISIEDEENLKDLKNWYLNGLWTEGYGY